MDVLLIELVARIKMGIASGSKSSAAKELLRRPIVNAPMIADSQERLGVPRDRDKPMVMPVCAGKSMSRHDIGVSKPMGRPVTIQCARTFPVRIAERGTGAKASCSRVPSAKSELNKRGNASKLESKTAIQITPGATLCSKLRSGLRPKGNRLIVKKNKHKTTKQSVGARKTIVSSRLHDRLIVFNIPSCF